MHCFLFVSTESGTDTVSIITPLHWASFQLQNTILPNSHHHAFFVWSGGFTESYTFYLFLWKVLQVLWVWLHRCIEQVFNYKTLFYLIVTTMHFSYGGGLHRKFCLLFVSMENTTGTVNMIAPMHRASFQLHNTIFYIVATEDYPVFPSSNMSL